MQPYHRNLKIAKICKEANKQVKRQMKKISFIKTGLSNVGLVGYHSTVQKTILDRFCFCSLKVSSVGLIKRCLYPMLRSKTSTQRKGCPGCDTKLHLMVRLQSWSYGECGALFQYHYSQVHSELEWQYLLESNLWIK